MNYNNSQLLAINHNEGPALIVAGPGSGKTAVVTMRVKTLIDTYHVNPGNILVITFTKAAANEMKERFDKLMGKKMPVSFGTFHGVYFTILRHAYNLSADNIISGAEQFEIVKRAVNSLEMEYDNEKDFVEGILGEISRVKGDMIDLDTYYPINCGKDGFVKIYTKYDAYLKRGRKLDFDDILLSCYELFVERKDILAAWQKKYKYILIDEFQDINIVQYKIISLLAHPENNIFAVGDDDQSIYGFRGSKPEIMQHFLKDYSSKIINLDVNYRSQSNIVSGAGNLISYNHNRLQKEIAAYNEPGEKIKIMQFADMTEEALKIIEKIKAYRAAGIKESEIAIITRTNEGARHLVEKFVEYNIPFSSKDSTTSIYSHWIAKNIIAYIKMAMGNRDRNIFLQIMNKPKRYISRDVLETSVVDFEAIKQIYRQDKSWMVERIAKLEEDLELLKNMNPFAAINYIRRGIGYDNYIHEYAQEKGINSDELFEVLGELGESTREFNTFSQWFTYIDQYEEMLTRKAKEKKQEKTKGINVVTMHGSKGLEYDVVFILDVNEHIIPYKKAVLDSEIEEERRMFYVAMTRAKKILNICYVDRSFNKELDPSRFIEEIKKKDDD